MILAFAWGFGFVLSISSIDSDEPSYIREEPGALKKLTEPTGADPTKAKGAKELSPREKLVLDSKTLTTLIPYTNSILIVAPAAAFVAVLMFLARKHKRILKYFLVAFLGLMSFRVSFLYFGLVPAEFLYHYSFFEERALIATWGMPMVLAALMFYLVLIKQELISLAALTFLGAGVGGSLANMIPFWTLMVLFFALSVLDVIMVSKGHLKHLAEDLEREPLLKVFMAIYRGMGTGLGDIVLYSALVAFALLNFGVSHALIATCGILIGWSINIVFLIKRGGGVLAGLPAPILLGLGPLFLSTFF